MRKNSPLFKVAGLHGLRLKCTGFKPLAADLLCQPRTFSPGERVFKPAEMLGI